MLEFIRSRAQSWIAWVIVGLLIIPFALWGINEYFSGGGSTAVATVNDTEIGNRDFQQTFFQQRQRMQESLGDAYDAELFDAKIKQEVLTGLIDQELLVQLGRDEGLRVGDTQLGLIIQSIDDFQVDGQFSKEAYETALRSQGQSKAGFEARLRRAIIASQIYAGFVETALVTPADLEAVRRLMTQQREVSYLQIPVARIIKEIAITPAEIEAYYSQNSTNFTTPERVSIDYLELNAEEIAKDIPLNEEALYDLYQAQKASFSVGEERRASHILIEVPEGAADEERTAAQEKAQGILARIKNGESFEELAKQFSDDTGSAQAGGDLGFFVRNTMEPAFDEAAFTLEKGEVSDLVQTPFGFHIIRLDEIHVGYARGFDEVREELEQQYRLKEAERIFLDQRERLANLTFENADTLSVAAQELNLPIKTSKLFGRQGGPGITAEGGVIKAAFSAEVLQDRMNSELVDLNQNQVVVLRIKEHEPASQRSLADVTEDIRIVLANQQAREKVRETGQHVLQRLEAGEDSDSIAKEMELQWQSLGLIRRDTQTVDGAILKTAFRLPRPQDSASYGATEIVAGDYAVVRVSKVEDDDTPMSDADKQALIRTLTNVYGNTAYSAVLQYIKDQADITINKGNL